MRYKTINWILAITNFISLLIIIQIIYKPLDLNPFDYDIDKISNINNVTLGFVLGYIVNSIFYLFSTIVPYELNKTRVLGIVTPYLSDIHNRLKITQLYLRHKFNKSRISDISDSDLLSFTGLAKSNMTFSYQEKIGNNWTPISYNSFTEIDFFEDERDLVMNNIEIILANPFLSGLDDKLIYNLTRLKTQLFYVGVKRYVEFKNSPMPFSYKDFEKYVKEHFELINEFYERTNYLTNKLNIKELQ
jgi:hypothetical protein